MDLFFKRARGSCCACAWGAVEAPNDDAPCAGAVDVVLLACAPELAPLGVAPNRDPTAVGPPPDPPLLVVVLPKRPPPGAELVAVGTVLVAAAADDDGAALEEAGVEDAPLKPPKSPPDGAALELAGFALKSEGAGPEEAGAALAAG